MKKVCTKCKGTGYITKKHPKTKVIVETHKCEVCNGTGFITITKP